MAIYTTSINKFFCGVEVMLSRSQQNEIKIEKLVKGMTSLNLINYGSADIGRFEHCVNKDPARKQWALQTAKTNLEKAGTPTMGLMGTGVNSKRGMAATASKVRERKIGVCHELAQLGADHLLKQMDANIIPRSSIKVVSHDAGYGGSHTFLLLDHTGDLSDLSKCVIVDPWAVTMGFIDTQGVYTSSNYPYKAMTKNLKLVFEVDAQGNEVANTAEKVATKVVPLEERGDRVKVQVSQEPMNLQSALRKTVNREALVSDEKPRLSKPSFESPVVSQPKPKVTAPVVIAPVRETQRHSSIFHASTQTKPNVSQDDAMKLLKAYFKVTKVRESATHKKKILSQLAIGVRDGVINPDRAVLLAVDLLMTNDARVGENSWSRKGEPGIENLKETFRIINEVDDTKTISNFLRRHAELPESDSQMRKAGELRQVSDKILNDPEVVRDVTAQSSVGSGLRA